MHQSAAILPSRITLMIDILIIHNWCNIVHQYIYLSITVGRCDVGMCSYFDLNLYFKQFPSVSLVSLERDNVVFEFKRDSRHIRINPKIPLLDPVSTCFVRDNYHDLATRFLESNRVVENTLKNMDAPQSPDLA
jgi:hypothetical protein